MVGECTARSYPNVQPGGSQCIHVGTRPTVLSYPALKTELRTFPIKKDCAWQFKWQEPIASQAVLSPTEVGGHEEGVWGSGLWLGVFTHASFWGTSSCWQVGRDMGNSMIQAINPIQMVTIQSFLLWVGWQQFRNKSLLSVFLKLYSYYVSTLGFYLF